MRHAACLLWGMQNEVRVDLGDRSYGIRIGSANLARLGEFCASQGLTSACLIVTDSNVNSQYGDACEETLRAVASRVHRAVVPSGEKAKSGEQLFALYDEAIAAG